MNDNCKICFIYNKCPANHEYYKCNGEYYQPRYCHFIGRCPKCGSLNVSILQIHVEPTNIQKRNGLVDYRLECRDCGNQDKETLSVHHVITEWADDIYNEEAEE